MTLFIYVCMYFVGCMSPSRINERDRITGRQTSNSERERGRGWKMQVNQISGLHQTHQQTN